VLTQEGLRVMHQLRRQLKVSESQIRILVRRDPELARAYLSQGGAALLLLDENSDSLFQEWRPLLEALDSGNKGGGKLTERIDLGSRKVIEEIVKSLSGE
jgi:hypothetical protein